MRFSQAVSALCVPALYVNAAALAKVSSDGLTVQTNAGAITGFYNSSAPNVRQFLGVPYAQPPIGDLRFAAPLPPTLRSSVLNTSSFGPSCMQKTSTSKTIYTEVVPEFLIEGPTSEDCLYLNIWAPDADASDGLLPVFIYIPGGGFTSGGANSIYKLPDQWIQRTQTHIVVVMNYRVNLFGFPNAAEGTDANVGVLDQRRAVEWVYDNIANFGGDPARLILWGQSAGAASSNDYVYANYQDPLIAGFISDSGSVGLLSNNDYAHANFTKLAQVAGCNQTDAAEQIACVRQVPATTLETIVSTYNSTPALTFTPVFDEKTFFANTTDRAVKGLVAQIPGIMGSNKNEGAGFVSWSPDGPGAAALEAITQSIIACPVGVEVSVREAVGLTTYRYQYSGNFSNISPVSWMGAYHSSELPLLFGTHNLYNGENSTFFEWEVSRFMETLWLSFATDPSSAPQVENGFVWPAYNASSDSMIELANGTTKVALVSGSIIDGNCSGILSSVSGAPA